MERSDIIRLIKEKESFLCVGLDTDLQKIPTCLREKEDPIFAFNRRIIDATLPYAVAYKPNTAFYEAYGIKGMQALQKTINYLRDKKVFTIADAKRGDIGNTSARYAEAFLSPEGDFNFDAVTVAPYMGEDSVSPFLSYENKWVILLALTSNKGASDFQQIEDKKDGKPLFVKVLEASKTWGNSENMMYVVGATQAEMLKEVRRYVPEHFLLVPGVGAQGGSLSDVCQYGMTSDIGLLINASRSILYASSGEDFAEKAAEEACKIRDQMKQIMKQIIK